MVVLGMSGAKKPRVSGCSGSAFALSLAMRSATSRDGGEGHAARRAAYMVRGTTRSHAGLSSQERDSGAANQDP